MKKGGRERMGTSTGFELSLLFYYKLLDNGTHFIFSFLCVLMLRSVTDPKLSQCLCVVYVVHCVSVCVVGPGRDIQWCGTDVYFS